MYDETMAYDEDVAERIRDLLAGEPRLTEKEMFEANGRDVRETPFTRSRAAKMVSNHTFRRGVPVMIASRPGQDPRPT